VPSHEPNTSLEGASQRRNDVNANRRQLISAISALIVLLGLLAYVMGRNYLLDRRRGAFDASDVVQQERSAIRETKTAFAELYAGSRMPAITVLVDDLANSAPPTISEKSLRSVPGSNPDGATEPLQPAKRRRTPAGVPGTARRSSASQDVLASASARSAVRQWRMLAVSPPVRASVLRRLGITLFLFHRPGGLNAFHLIPLVPPAKTALPNPPSTPGSKPAAPRPAVSNGLTFAEETRLWDAIYGPVAPRQAEVGTLRSQLGRLNLGWFESIAAATLYNRAGLSAQAALATQQARRSADALVAVLTIEAALPIIGGVLILGYFGAWLVRQVEMSGRPAAKAPSVSDPNSLANFCSLPATSMGGDIPRNAPAERSEPLSPFSFNTRIITFVVFFGCYLLIAWPLRSILPLVAHWSSRDILRLSMMLELIAYLPNAAITLLVFKRLGERDANRRLTWRETLAALGLWTTRPVSDVLAAAGAYSMTIPAIYLAAGISLYLFRGFHTPVHPVDSILLRAQDDLTRALVVIQAVIVAPIMEELTFRGLLFEGLRQRWGLAAGAVLSSAVFALSHNTLPGGFLVLWTLGFSFAIVYRRRRSIVPNILMHALHNGLVTLLMLEVFAR